MGKRRKSFPGKLFFYLFRRNNSKRKSSKKSVYSFIVRYLKTVSSGCLKLIKIAFFLPSLHLASMPSEGVVFWGWDRKSQPPRGRIFSFPIKEGQAGLISPNLWLFVCSNTNTTNTEKQICS